MKAKLLHSSIHRFVMKLKMTAHEEIIQKIERAVTFSVKKQNAIWNVQFVITSAGTGGVISFSTDPDHILRETHRIVCTLSNDLQEEHVITLGGSRGMLCKQLGFFDWYNVKDFIKSNGGKDILKILKINLKICFDIIDVFSNETAITSDLKMLPFFESGAYSDVVIKTAQKEFKVHKLVLAARSPVFAAMFNNDMQEATTGIITISNLKTEVLEEMLRYMYSSVSTKLTQMPCQLFAAAHMYDVQDLQKLCKDYMLHHIRVANVVETLKFCDTYALEDVKERVLKFIENNEALVIEEKEYQVYLKENISVESVTKNLMLAQKYELAKFKLFLMDFIAKNYAKVVQNQEYRLMYSGGESMKLILEIDEYIANYIAGIRL